MDLPSGNLLANLPSDLPEELFEPLLERPGFRLERIVSLGHTTAPGDWYDQERDEWVLLLRGRAQLLIQGERMPRELGPGDWMLLPAHCRHRVEWTDPDVESVWLALHHDRH